MVRRRPGNHQGQTEAEEDGGRVKSESQNLPATLSPPSTQADALTGGRDHLQALLRSVPNF